MTLEQAREAVQKEYPQQDIGLGFEYEGYWYFRVGEGINGGIHAVDSRSGFVTAALPTLAMLNDDGFRKAFQKASGIKKNGTDDLEQTDIRSWRHEDFLEHHGIRGQRWYHRRFQDKDGKWTAAGRARYGKGGNEKNLEGDTKNGVTTEAVIAAVYLTPIAVMSAITITTNAIEKHNKKLGDKLLDKKKIANTDKKFSNENPPKKIEGEHTAEEDMSKVNEAYGELRPQTLNNCSHCSITMELRRRGFDVCSRTSSEPVYTHKQLEKAFKPKPEVDNVVWDGKPKNFHKMSKDEQRQVYDAAVKKGEIAKEFKDVEKNFLKKYPEGARGIFTVGNPVSMIGHAMAFEVKKGKVVIYDCQSNMKFDLASPPAAFTQCFPVYTSMAYRLDNKKINWDGLNDICAERIRK